MTPAEWRASADYWRARGHLKLMDAALAAAAMEEKMGDVKQAVKGPGTGGGGVHAGASNDAGGALVERLAAMRDELSGLITQKDADVEDEGPAEAAENKRKAGVLRASFSLVSAAHALLEDY